MVYVSLLNGVYLNLVNGCLMLTKVFINTLLHKVSTHPNPYTNNIKKA